jgi:hypothetical protein
VNIMTDTAQTPNLTHPAWCDPRCCTTLRDVDGAQLVFHRAVLIAQPGVNAHLVQCDEFDQAGRFVLADPGELVIDIFGGALLLPEEDADLAAAFAQAHAAGIALVTGGVR